MDKYILSVIIGVIAITNYSFCQIAWEDAIDVAPSSYGQYNPKVVLDANGDPVVSWGDDSLNLLASNWNGGSFNTPVEINGTYDVLQSVSYGGEITSIGDTIYGIFKESPMTTGGIWVVKSIDGGSSFSPPVPVNNTGGVLSELVQITCDPYGNPIVAFNQFDASWTNPRWAISRSDDFGLSFNTEVIASGWSGGSQIVCECCPAGIVSDGANTVLAYRDNLSNLRDIWAGFSVDGGNSFSSGMNIDQSGWIVNGCPSTGPDVELIGDTLYSTFMSAGGGSSRVYFSKASLSSGAGATANMVTGNFAGLAAQNYPRISIDNNYGALVWAQVASAQYEIIVSYTEDINQGFPTTFYSVASNGYNPDVVINGGEIHVVWRDSPSGTVKYRKGHFSSSGLNSISADGKKVEKTFDLLGRETSFKPGVPLIIMYNDGTVERVFSVEE